MILLKSLYKEFFGSKSKDWYEKEYDRIVGEINAIYGDDEEAVNQHVETSYMPDAKFFRYNGTVTNVYSDGSGRIDEKNMFSNEAASRLQLKVGDRVSYTARYLSEDQPVLIYKINSKEESAWECNNFDYSSSGETLPLNVRIKFLHGKVTCKLNGEIAIESKYLKNHIKLNITDSGCHFNPREGDQIELEAKIAVNPDDCNDCTILEFYGIKANDSKTVKAGKITSFKKRLSYGLVDEKYIFFLDVLQHSDNQNMVPNIGDTVSCDVITSDQKTATGDQFYWRCINLVKIRSAIPNGLAVTPQEMPINDTEDEIDIADCGIRMTKNDALKVTLDATFPQKQIELVAENLSNKSHKISQVKFNHSILDSQIKCDALYLSHTIQAGGRFIYRIEVSGKFPGLHKLQADFQIDDKHWIRRCFTIDVKYIDEKPSTTVNRSKAYTKKIYTELRDVVKGVRPVNSPHFVDFRLERFEVPKQLSDEWALSIERYDIDDDSAGVLSHLTPSNYASYFHRLLHFEEIFMRHEFRMYDQDRGHFYREGEFLVFEMDKNVSECRPSIIIGDMILAENLLNTKGEQAQYQGFIHRIRKKCLLLKFDEEFHVNYRGEDMKLIFKFSRSKFIKPHNAIERIAKKMRRDVRDGRNLHYLFPNHIQTGRLQIQVELKNGQMEVAHIKNNELPWFNENLNDIQKLAVVNVLRGEVKMSPYLVFGPPGTGKTSTLIEIILQLYKKGNTRLLVAAPSNSAANLITKLLAECGKIKDGHFARIVSHNTVERDQVPDELREHCITVDIAAPRSKAPPQNPIENGIRIQCNSEDISLYRIVISTCMTFGSLLQMKFKPGHFTHAIIDEAGQCTEPEIAIPVSLIEKDDGQIILAGDPNQLGPVVLSPIAQRCGLGKSLLSRLLDQLPYQPDVGRNGGYDERMVTQLLHNYRSLPSILDAYSKLSYESRLIAKISDEDSNEQRLLAMVQRMVPCYVENPEQGQRSILKHVPNYGVYFMGVIHDDDSPSCSTSWRNSAEVLEVVMVANRLFKDCGLSEDDIGIITPYTLQVKEIRQVGESQFEGKQPKIGSVEEFQGQERNVIIISTVRSKSSNISHDGKYGLGFINNKNRLNVAISRARAMLIIIGNPYTLSQDENWRQIIYDCYINGSYAGCSVPEAVRKHMD